MYSADLRQAALHLYGIVRSIRKASALLQVGRSSIARWVQTGGVRKPYKRRYSKTGATVEIIRETLARRPFISSKELASAIRTTLDISVSKELVRAVIRKSGFTQKKAKFFGRPTGVDQKTYDFIQSRNAMLASGHMFASIDETSFGRHTPAVRAPHRQRRSRGRCCAGRCTTLMRRAAMTRARGTGMTSDENCNGSRCSSLRRSMIVGVRRRWSGSRRESASRRRCAAAH